MYEFQHKRKVRKFIYSRLALVILLIILVLLAKAVWNANQKANLAEDSLKVAKNDLNDLSLRKDNLTASISKLSTDKGKETVLRTDFPVALPGEKVIVLVNQDNATSSVDSSDNGFWAKLKSLFQ